MEQLMQQYVSFVDSVMQLTGAQFSESPNSKWNAGQTLDHLCRSVSALRNGMQLPRFIFSFLFGKAGRSSCTYDELVAAYIKKLDEGGRAHGRYLPQSIPFEMRRVKTASLIKAARSICRSLALYNEQQLDRYILPHPLLGKISIREMMYFTIYHAEHHHIIMLRNLNQ